MAKSRTKKPPEPSEPKPEQPTKPEPLEPLEPQKVHELFGLPGPYDPPPAPISLIGYCTFWDAGCSIQLLHEKYPASFYPQDFPGGARFARGTDSWTWRQIRLAPIEPGKTFAEQLKQLTNADKPAAARELVTFLILHFLITGERLAMGRWRCADVLPSGRRTIVGPFSPLGLDIGSVSDDWESPGVALSAIFTPMVKRM